jgi:hypothetical protein
MNYRICNHIITIVNTFIVGSPRAFKSSIGESSCSEEIRSLIGLGEVSEGGGSSSN